MRTRPKPGKHKSLELHPCASCILQHHGTKQAAESVHTNDQEHTDVVSCKGSLGPSSSRCYSEKHFVVDRSSRLEACVKASIHDDLAILRHLSFRLPGLLLGPEIIAIFEVIVEIIIVISITVVLILTIIIIVMVVRIAIIRRIGIMGITIAQEAATTRLLQAPKRPSWTFRIQISGE